jgi:hypothetical protein
MQAPPAAPKKSGPPFKPFAVTPGQLIITGFKNGVPLYATAETPGGQPAPTMTPAQERGILLDLARENTHRAELKLPPMSFDDWVAANPTPLATGQTQGASAGGNGMRSNDPDNPAATAAPQPAAAPTQTGQPVRTPAAGRKKMPAQAAPVVQGAPGAPSLVVTGAPPEKVERVPYPRSGSGGRSYRRGGGGSGSGSGSERDAGFIVDGVNRANNLEKDALDKAADFEDRGFKDKAKAERAKAARYRQTGDQVRARAQKNPHVVLNEDGSAAAAGTKPKVKLPPKFRITW